MKSVFKANKFCGVENCLAFQYAFCVCITNLMIIQYSYLYLKNISKNLVKNRFGLTNAHNDY